MEVHLADNSSVYFHQIVHLSLQFADGPKHTVDFQAVLALNHAIILGMPFLLTLNLSIDCNTHNIMGNHPQLTSVLPPAVFAAP